MSWATADEQVLPGWRPGSRFLAAQAAHCIDWDALTTLTTKPA